jgi:hypothetical protein
MYEYKRVWFSPQIVPIPDPGEMSLKDTLGQALRSAAAALGTLLLCTHTALALTSSTDFDYVPYAGPLNTHAPGIPLHPRALPAPPGCACAEAKPGDPATLAESSSQKQALQEYALIFCTIYCLWQVMAGFVGKFGGCLQTTFQYVLSALFVAVVGIVVYFRLST